MMNLKSNLLTLTLKFHASKKHNAKKNGACKRKADEQARLEKDRQKQEQAKAQWTDADSKLKSKGKLDKHAEDIIDILKVQIMPSLECVECNDKLTKRIFNHTVKQYQKMMNGSTAGIIEKKNHKKRGELVSKYSVQNAEGYENDSPLTEFDRAVLGVLISEYLVGNRYTTINIIFRALIGKVGKGCDGINVHKNQRDAIAHSVTKLMGTIVDFRDVADSLDEMEYTDKDGNKVKLKVANLLFAEILDAKINGQVIDDIIFFKQNSPLFDIADAKSQVIRYPHELLDVPNQNNTPRIIALKKYVMRRICEIKLHKMTPTITFKDVFTKCRMLNCSRDTKMDARNAIVKLCEHLKSKNFISDFQLVKERNEFVSVRFTF